MSLIFTPWLPGEGLERLLSLGSQRADLLFPITAVSKGLSPGEGKNRGERRRNDKVPRLRAAKFITGNTHKNPLAVLQPHFLCQLLTERQSGRRKRG